MNKIIVVSGPTASGKTALAVELAKLYGGEVISADSMQIYTDMDVASAKATPEEQQGIPHHLMNFLDPSQSFSVAEWVGMAECDYAYRGELRRFAEENGAAALLEKLREVDPETAAELHENNVSRVIRALEVYKTTGHTIAQAKRESRNAPSPYEFILLTLDFEPRELLHERINRRVDIMLKNGLEQEARRCFEQPDRPTAAQAIGCKELYPYFRGEKSLEECVEELKLRTRQYAKRQLTWFRRDSRFSRIIIQPGEGLPDVISAAREIIEREK